MQLLKNLSILASSHSRETDGTDIGEYQIKGDSVS